MSWEDTELWLLTPSSMDLAGNAALGPAVLVLWGAWALLLGCAAVGVRALVRARAWRRREVQALAMLVLLALVVRFELTTPTPEMRWRLAFGFPPGRFGLADIEKYGLGLPLLVRTVVAVVGADLRVPYQLNLLLGGLTVLPMVGLARSLGVSWSAALWAGFAFAVTPMLVWYANTDGPFIADALFTLTTFWGVAAYARTGRAVWLAVAAAAFVATAQMRVESVLTGPVALALALALPTFGWRRPAPWVAVVAVALALVPHVALVGPAALASAQQRSDTASDVIWYRLPEQWMVFDATVQSVALMALAPLGLLAPGLSRRTKLWAVLCFMLFASAAPDAGPTSTAFSVIRYQLRSLLPWALMAGLGLDLLARHFGRSGAALGVVGSLLGLRLATTSSMLEREYAALQASLNLVPPTCTVVTYLSQSDVGLFPPVHYARLIGVNHTWIDMERDPIPTEGCVVYWLSSACSGHYQGSYEGMGLVHPDCERFANTWVLTPLATNQIEPDPVGPMGIPNRFPGVPIPLGFFTVEGRREVVP